MQIAELFVRLRGDTSDLDRKLSASERQMLRLHGSTTKLESGFRSTQLQTGRLGNQFAGLAGQIAGVHPIVGNLAQVMGNFAIGGLVTVGVLGGVALIALAYDELTGSARKAKKETDEFIKSLVDETKAAFNASMAGRQLAADRAYLALQAAKEKSPVGIRSVIGSLLRGGQPFIAQTDAAAAVKAVADAETAVVQANLRMGKTWEDLNPPLKKVKSGVDELKFGYNQLRDAIDKVRAATEAEGMAFWTAYANRGAAMAETAKEIAAFFAPNLDVNHVPGALKDFGTTISGVDTNIGLTKEQIKTRDELVGTLDKNTLTMKDAIWGAASQSAGIIVNALNIGGGGKGSSLGGAIGGTAGFALGFAFGGGPIGGAIGSTIGNIAGSLLGGLFDSNKKAVNSNTQALIRLTSAILNTPSGFKAAPYRHNAADARELYDAVAREEARRRAHGGATPLGMALT